MMTDTNYTVMGDHRIRWDDRWHKIEIHGYTLHLSPTQYRICQAFLTHSAPSTISGEVVLLAYREREDLQQEVELPSRHLLTKHISILNGRINIHGLSIQPFHQGYTLILSGSRWSFRAGRE